MKKKDGAPVAQKSVAGQLENLDALRAPAILGHAYRTTQRVHGIDRAARYIMMQFTVYPLPIEALQNFEDPAHFETGRLRDLKGDASRGGSMTPTNLK